MRKLFSILAIALVAVAVFSSCNKEENVTNKMTLRGHTYSIEHAICGNFQGFYNLDVDTTGGDDNIHGYGGFDAEWVGKTTNLSGPFFLSFNPMSGPSIDPVIKSGTVKITETKGGLNIKVDCVETTGDKFTMDFFAEDKGENF
jgi:hypothetical protein